MTSRDSLPAGARKRADTRLRRGEVSVLVVDPDSRVRAQVQELLRGNDFRSEGVEDIPGAVAQLARQPYDAVLLDAAGISPSDSNPFATVTANGSAPAVILMAEADSPLQADLALSWDARGLLRKPLRNQEALFTLSAALQSRQLLAENRVISERMQSEVLKQTKELLDTIQRLERVELRIRRSYEETVHRLARATEYRDMETGRHLQRMSQYSAMLMRHLGFDHDRCEMIRIAAPMHDVGKIGIPDSILYKSGAHTPQETEVMKQHAQIGYEILSGSGSELLDLAASIAWTHHEKYDGSGYPRGLGGQTIPLEGRVVAIADVFDALTSKRVYKPAFPVDQAVAIMSAGAGKHFDPELLQLFWSCQEEVLTIKHQF
ncbi:MAG TPA: HD domain-containing phosphohydrolase, partial [bacterium]|nr:HD domain-containing phosphohydrolase [bacterium]